RSNKKSEKKGRLIISEEIITVNGPIKTEEMGLTLPHEHIMVDFIGADKAGKHRYRREEVVEVMLPYLEEIKEKGVKTFVDCTPMYLARDVKVLKELADKTGLNIITNTGQYKEPYLPRDTFEISAEELAAQWIEEFEKGIEETDIRPGFIKTAVDPEGLNKIQQKVIKAAAITSKNTGLTIATHTGCGQSAGEIIDILINIGIKLNKWIFVHAQNEKDYNILRELAEKGVWIELDGIGPDTIQEHIDPLVYLIDKGLEDRILLSQDAGWYEVGNEPGKEKQPYSFIFDNFLPETEKMGITPEVIDRIMIDNPASVFAID
ncbi:MAG: phosphotriesterase family protein, partial [Halanaerobiaceae bacterium]